MRRPFLGLGRADREDEHPAGRDRGQGPAEDPPLHVDQRRQVSLAASVAQLRVAAQGAQARAGRIHEHEVLRGRSHGERVLRVRGDAAHAQTEPLGLGLHALELLPRHVQGHDVSALLGEVAALAPGGGADIQRRAPRRGRDQEPHELRGLVLHLEVALGEAGETRDRTRVREGPRRWGRSDPARPPHRGGRPASSRSARRGPCAGGSCAGAARRAGCWPGTAHGPPRTRRRSPSAARARADGTPRPRGGRGGPRAAAPLGRAPGAAAPRCTAPRRARGRAPCRARRSRPPPRGRARGRDRAAGTPRAAGAAAGWPRSCRRSARPRARGPPRARACAAACRGRARSPARRRAARAAPRQAPPRASRWQTRRRARRASTPRRLSPGLG